MSQDSVRYAKFYGQDGKRYWGGLDYTSSVKLIAKMFREITHMKPPRGRQGRLLDQTKHFAVETIGDGSYRQDTYTAWDELGRIENEVSEYNEYSARYKQDPEAANEQDLQRLQRWHTQYEGKKKIMNTTQSMQDLVQGLMGLGLRNIEYSEVGYSSKAWQATMNLEGFRITITQTGSDDDD